MKSVLQSEKECFVCKTTQNLEEHHCLYGTSNRKMSEKYGLKVWLCHEHHTGNTGVHFNKELDLQIKELAQAYYEEHIGSKQDFMRDFGRNYIDFGEF